MSPWICRGWGSTSGKRQEDWTSSEGSTSNWSDSRRSWKLSLKNVLTACQCVQQSVLIPWEGGPLETGKSQVSFWIYAALCTTDGVLKKSPLQSRNWMTPRWHEGRWLGWCLWQASVSPSVLFSHFCFGILWEVCWTHGVFCLFAEASSSTLSGEKCHLGPLNLGSLKPLWTPLVYFLETY